MAPIVATTIETSVPNSSLIFILVTILTNTMLEKNKIAPDNMKIKLLDSTPQRKCCCARGVTIVSQEETPIFTNNASVKTIIKRGENNLIDRRSSTISSSGDALASIERHTKTKERANNVNVQRPTQFNRLI